jgi:hypothetical protein
MLFESESATHVAGLNRHLSRRLHIGGGRGGQLERGSEGRSVGQKLRGRGEGKQGERMVKMENGDGQRREERGGRTRGKNVGEERGGRTWGKNAREECEGRMRGKNAREERGGRTRDRKAGEEGVEREAGRGSGAVNTSLAPGEGSGADRNRFRGSRASHLAAQPGACMNPFALHRSR